MFFRIFALFLALLLTAARPPELSPRDTKSKIQEILKAHVNYHELTTELVARAFVNFLEEVDPGKTYLIKKEVLAWTEPSDELLGETRENMKKEDFSNF